MSLFGPMEIDVLSMKTSCTEPLSLVCTRSRCTTLAPIWITRTPAPGGRLCEAGLTAPAVPTTWARTDAAPNSPRAATEEKRTMRREKLFARGMAKNP
jgi:hypothetical protein